MSDKIKLKMKLKLMTMSDDEIKFEIVPELEFIPRDENKDLNEIIGAIRKYKQAQFVEDNDSEKLREEMARKMADYLNFSGFLDKWFTIEMVIPEEE